MSSESARCPAHDFGVNPDQTAALSCQLDLPLPLMVISSAESPSVIAPFGACFTTRKLARSPPNFPLSPRVLKPSSNTEGPEGAGGGAAALDAGVAPEAAGGG